MTPTRRCFALSLVLAPAALALTRPSALLAQEETIDPFGGLPPPNVFFSPCGRPYRAKPGAPYPVVDWFKQADANADGKIDRAEFIADAATFFKLLDRNGDGVISPQEVSYYEQRVAPEVLGMRVQGTSGPVIDDRPRLWRVQMGGGMGGMGGGGMGSTVDPGGDTTESDAAPAPSAPYDASGKGASPYGFFDEPEPVTAADLHFRGVITKADFTQLASAHFKTLDPQDKGYLTLEGLPKTPVQRRLEKLHHGRRS